MLQVNVNSTISGVSSTPDGALIASFNASFNDNGSVYVTISVNNIELYRTNKSTVDADFANFVAKLQPSED